MIAEVTNWHYDAQAPEYLTVTLRVSDRDAWHEFLRPTLTSPRLRAVDIYREVS